MQRPPALIVALSLWAAFACQSPQPMETYSPDPASRRDVHSHSNPEEIRVTHVELDLSVDFEAKALRGTATLSIEPGAGRSAERLILDSRGLSIDRVEVSAGDGSFESAEFHLGETDRILGAPVEVTLASAARTVRLYYETSPDASALQWLEPRQTAGKRHPFLFTQSQAIHARSWIPLQDSPAVRVTYSATIRTARGLTAVMSAASLPGEQEGVYRFEMPQPIPPYLIALAVGDLEFRAMSERTGVWAEPPVVDKAAREFEDTEAMMQAVEGLYGPYRWERYDILVLPPSFPFGGMENPRLTFATPTILAGDKSLVSLVAHELAHSWSGNLVTNATWRDFWLNEGFTVYLENRIQELVFGEERAKMEAALEVRSLKEEMKELQPRDEILHVDLEGRDPDEGFTLVPYVKGMLFLRRLEEVFGRERFDAFLQGYFEHFAFQSITTGEFVDYLEENLLAEAPGLAAKVNVQQWLAEPGLPETAPIPVSETFSRVEEIARRWAAGEANASQIAWESWSTQERLHLLHSLPDELSDDKLAELDKAFRLTTQGNSEILHRWLLMAVRNGYGPAYPRVESFLIEVGRRKFLEPLYKELAKTEAGKRRALAIYEQARPGYHPIAVATIDEVLGYNAETRPGGNATVREAKDSAVI